MDYLYIIFDEFRFMGQLIAAGLMLTLPAIERRRHFAVRAVVGAAVCLALTLLYLAMRALCDYVGTDLFMRVAHITWYVLLTLLFAAYLEVCFKLNPSELLCLVILAYCMQHIAYVLVNELVFFGFAYALYDVFAFYALLNIAVCAALYALCYFIFVPSIRDRDHLAIEDNAKVCVIFFILLCVFVASTFVNQHEAGRPPAELNYLAVVSDLCNCFFVMLAEYAILRANKLYLEKAAFVRMYNNALRQYENFKKSVDYINVKCHDVKHQLRRLEQEGKLEAASVRELEAGISVYDSFAKTGNKTLDMLLADKHIECLSPGISFSYMAEAEALCGLEDSDVYALFANILDNAIAHIKKIADPHKRFLRLSVRPVGNMLHIHQENYLEGKLEFADGLPVTTDSDRIFHGFGMKSIRMIAKKYGGSLRVAAEESAFKLDILLPMA